MWLGLGMQYLVISLGGRTGSSCWDLTGSRAAHPAGRPVDGRPSFLQSWCGGPSESFWDSPRQGPSIVFRCTKLRGGQRVGVAARTGWPASRRRLRWIVSNVTAVAQTWKWRWLETGSWVWPA